MSKKKQDHSSSKGLTAFQKWVKALRIFNKGKKFTIPRKGTPAYAKVKRIMARM